MRVLQYATIAAVAATSVNALDEVEATNAVDMKLESGLPGCVWWCVNMQKKEQETCELECAPKKDGEATEEEETEEETEETPVEEEETEEEETPVEEEEETPVEEEDETPVEEEEETPVEEEEETPVEEEEETPVEEEEETPVEEEEETPVEEEEETPVEEEETPAEEEEQPTKDDDYLVDLDDTDDIDRADDVSFEPKVTDDNPPEIDDHDEVFPYEKHHPELDKTKGSGDKWKAFLLPFGVASMLAGFGLLYRYSRKAESDKDETLTQPLNAENNA